MPAPGSAAHEAAETPVTGTNASQAQAAAVKYVGSGTAGAVTTDFTKTGYEVTVTKSDGSQVEVHLDSSFNVVQGGPGHPGGPNDNDADDRRRPAPAAKPPPYRQAIPSWSGTSYPAPSRYRRHSRVAETASVIAVRPYIQACTQLEGRLASPGC
jgi:hypothetical protein